MIIRILKNDLKRKKVMNIIILLFILISAVFMASSVNNIVSSLNGLDYYFEKAEVPSYSVILRDGEENIEFEKNISNIENVKSIKKERIFLSIQNSILKEGEVVKELGSNVVLMSIDEKVINYFDKNNNEINEIEEGYIYLVEKAMKNSGLKEGDTISISTKEGYKDFIIKGYFKDAPLGSNTISLIRILMNGKDYEEVYVNDMSSMLEIYYIDSPLSKLVEKEVDKCSTLLFNLTYQKAKFCYFVNILSSVILLVLSICMLFIAFSVLRFAINFTIGEDFQELGIMRAIGIKDRKIRLIYIIKYCFLSILGSLIGFFVSIPFSKILLVPVSKSMYIGNDNMILYNIISCIFIVIVVILFSYRITKKVLKLSPIDAIRNINLNEKYAKKRGIRLNNKFKNTKLYLAINDLISSPKKYIAAFITFFACFLLVISVSNICTTFKGEEVINLIGFSHFDVTINYNSNDQYKELNKEDIEKYVDEVNETLNENKIEGKCYAEIGYTINLYTDTNSASCQVYQSYNNNTDNYIYYKGLAPKKDNELAITNLIAEKLEVNIGDKIRIKGLNQEFIITGYIQAVTNMGELARFSENCDLDELQVLSTLIMIEIDEKNKKDLNENIDLIKEIYGSENVSSVNEMVEDTLNMKDTIESIKYIVMTIVIILIILVTILMERTFISNEKKDIALLKAIGYKNYEIVIYHSLRFVIVCVIALITAFILSYPIGSLLITIVSGSMGAKGINTFGVNYMELLILLIILLFVSLVSALLTSLNIKSVKTRDISTLE